MKVRFHYHLGILDRSVSMLFGQLALGLILQIFLSRLTKTLGL